MIKIDMNNLTEDQKKTILLGFGIGLGLGVVAVATAPAWLPAAKAKALQVAGVKTAKILLTATIWPDIVRIA